LQRQPSFTQTFAALHYADSCETLVHRFKFGADQAGGRLLATALAQRATGVEMPDFLVAIPLSCQRLRARGFDQSWELAKTLSSRVFDEFRTTFRNLL
jgi:predicted amidophosphoribosyltransferase